MLKVFHLGRSDADTTLGQDKLFFLEQHALNLNRRNVNKETK